MELWSGPSERFVNDTTHNKIASLLSDAFFRHFHYKPSDGEVNAWRNSLRATSLVFCAANLDDHGVLLEYQLPLSSLRLDCMVCGTDASGADQAIILELKQWDHCREGIGENLVTTWVGGAERDVLHPSAQVFQYQQYLEDTHTAFHEGSAPVGLSSCAYLHNYPNDPKDALFAKRYAPLLKSSPTFTMDDVEPLKAFLLGRVGEGKGMPVLDRVRASKYRASKKLMEHVAQVIDNKHEYTLLDEQLVVFDKVLGLARAGLDSRKRTVLLIRGGPGTGKSVVAINLMSRLTREGFNAHYATGSKAFTETLRENIGKRAAVQIKYFNSYSDAGPDAVDVLICDEAHRLREKSGTRFKPSKSGKLQVQEILDAAKLPVFFIDDRQVVRPGEVGSCDHIRQEAEKRKCTVLEYELAAQFRCAGSDAYVNWVTNTLGIARTANAMWEGDERFDFRIFPSPETLEEAIRFRASEGASARLAAGFCWPWSNQRGDGSLEDDVVIGEWRRPWNAKHEATRLAKGIPKAHLWAHSPGGIGQVGCVYTAQGFEFDYVGVIFGPDLRYNWDQQDWTGDPTQSQDGIVKRGGDRFAELVKNTYRVLLSRGMKGCYVYFTDRETEKFVRARIERGVADARLEEFRRGAQVVDAIPAEPFRRLSPEEADPFQNSVPLYELAIAAGSFSDEQHGESLAIGSEDTRKGDFQWVELPDNFRPQRGSFVAKVVGESMNNRIPNGAWCLFKVAPAGSRQGKVVLAQHREIQDSDTGGHYTVKVYESRKKKTKDGSWRHEEISLKPDSSDLVYEPMVFDAETAEDLRIIAELVAVLA